MPPLSALTDWPPWAVMWALAAAVFALCKWLTWRYTPTPRPRRCGGTLRLYLVLWPGLDAKAFLDPRRCPMNERPGGMVSGCLPLRRSRLGAAACVGNRAAYRGGIPPGVWVGMTGLVFLLHFGLFHVLSCAWRAVGVDAKPLMNWPILSASVSEFWSKRWNLAFRDLTHRFLFRPFATRWGARVGLAAVFLFSGIVHDVVISLPAGAGYGLPTLYFVIQGAALLVERSKAAKRLGLGGGWRGRAFTAVVVIGPACALFHPWFAYEVVLPFLDVLGCGPVTPVTGNDPVTE